MTRSTRVSRAISLLASVSAVVLLAGCAAPEPEATEEAQPAAEEAGGMSTETDRASEVFFANIEDEGTYTSPLEIIFAVEDFDIVPVEDPPAVREGEGHYHLAVDADCVAAGEIIPPGNPSYIHFGDGSDRITMQLDPGQHTFCLQVADGEHRVLDGPGTSSLTKQIIITIEEAPGEE